MLHFPGVHTVYVWKANIIFLLPQQRASAELCLKLCLFVRRQDCTKKLLKLRLIKLCGGGARASREFNISRPGTNLTHLPENDDAGLEPGLRSNSALLVLICFPCLWTYMCFCVCKFPEIMHSERMLEASYHEPLS